MILFSRLIKIPNNSIMLSNIVFQHKNNYYLCIKKFHSTYNKRVMRDPSREIIFNVQLIYML